MLPIAAAACLGMWIALRIVPFRRLVRWTDVAPRRAEDPDRAPVARIVWAVEAVGRRLFPARPCLPQALAARGLLARRGVPTTLRIGIQKDEDVDAHAWLERDGEVLIGGETSPDEYHVLTAS